MNVFFNVHVQVYVQVLVATKLSFITYDHDSFLQSFSGGLIHHVVQDGWQMNAFRQLRCIRFGGCRHALEMDLGFLIITAAQK